MIKNDDRVIFIETSHNSPPRRASVSGLLFKQKLNALYNSRTNETWFMDVQKQEAELRGPQEWTHVEWRVL